MNTEEIEPEPANGAAPVTEIDLDHDQTLDERPDRKRSLRRPPSVARRDETPEMRSIHRRADESLRDWLDGLSRETGAFKIAVVRKRPKTLMVHGRSHKTDGTLGSYEELVDEETIANDYGGGDYTLRISKMTDKGPRFVTSTDVSIPGDPRVDNLRNAEDLVGAPPPVAVAPARDPLVETLMNSTLSRAKELESKLDSARAQSGSFDAAMLATLTQPLRDQNERLERELREMRTEIREAARQAPREDPHAKAESKLIDKLIDGDSSRLEHTRERFESEIRTIKENAREDEKRLLARHEREVDDLKKDRDRALADQRSSYEREIAALRASFDLQRTILSSDKDRIAADLAAAKAELGELRAKKDKSLLEQASDLKKIKEALDDGDGDEGESKGLVGMIGKLVDSKAAEVFVEKMMKDAAPAPAPAQPAMPAVGRPFRGADDNFYINNGQAIVPWTPPKKKKKTPADAAPPGDAPEGAEGATAAPPEPQVVMPEVDPENAAKAIMFLETAYRGGADPVQFADSARTMVPADIVNAIRAVGVDPFLDRVAGLDRSSPLAQQAGRNWVRKVGKALIGE